MKTNKGEAVKDETKYVEFVFNADLNDICDIVFYDKQIKKEDPKTDENKEEDPKAEETQNEDQKKNIKIEDIADEEEIPSPQTEDSMKIAKGVLIIAIVTFGISFLKFNR